MTTADYLTDLVAQRDALADNLVTKGIQAEKTEKFNTLVPKVLNIQTGNPETELLLKAIIERDVDNLGQIELPDGITSIASYLFYGCDNLQLDTIPDSVTSIGSYAFYDCNNLNPTSLSENLTSIGSYAFYDCGELALTELPDSVETIGTYAFNNCVKLVLDKLPDNLTTIGTHGFYGCSILPLTKLPDNLITIGSSAFEWCSSLVIEEIPIGVKVLPQYGFSRCRIKTISGEGVIEIQQACFYYTPLQEVYFPNLNKLGQSWSAHNNNSLKKATFGTLTSVHSDAFNRTGSGGLTELIIGEGTTASLNLSVCGLLPQTNIYQIIEKLADMTGSAAPKITVHANCTAIDTAHLDMINAKNWEHNFVLEEVSE